MNATFWSAVAAIAAAVGLVVVSYGAIVALRQLREVTRTRHLEAMLRVYDLIASDDARESRRFLYTELTSLPESTSGLEWLHIDRTAALFDRVGNLVKLGLVPKAELMDTHHAVIIRSWRVLEPYVKYRRELSGGNHAGHFEMLAGMAEEYWVTVRHDDATLRLVEFRADRRSPGGSTKGPPQSVNPESIVAPRPAE